MEMMLPLLFLQHQHMTKMSSVSIQMRDSVMDLRKYWNVIENSFPNFDLQVYLCYISDLNILEY
uniref:E3 ubiquitin-protein ligase RGLG2-like isoform X1 n=1 Tax=Rhizophora mucronata TaxID=61149 RepID=A0A2P2LX60_RHIMU